AAEAASRLEHEHPGVVARETDGRAEAGKSGAHNGHVEGHGCHSHCRTAMKAWRGRATRTRPENTSQPLRSMRVRVSKYTARMISAATSRRRSSTGRAAMARR